MRSVVEIGASVPAFLGKLWKLVNDSETNHLISWSHGGKTFVIKNQADFARDLLPLYYKHNNMASFIRQLNMYGFHKITSVENGGLRYEKDEIEFSHPCFMRGHAYLLEHIKRKIANPKAIMTSSENGEKILLKPEIMNKVLADVKQMKGKQENLDAKFSAMKQENEALWREVAILRQKHIKQQQIVNNLIQFLMSLVQPSRAGANNANGVGVKRPYQLMINSAAHHSAGDNAYPGRSKNMKLGKDAGLLEELIEENLEEGPTIYELAHDDMMHGEASQDAIHPVNFVTVDINAASPNVPMRQSPGAATSQYHVTMEDGDELETETARTTFPIGPNDLLSPVEVPAVSGSPSPLPTASPTNQSLLDQIIPASPSTSKCKQKTPSSQNTSLARKSMLSPSNFKAINPAADLKLPAEIFASDDSVSDAGVAAAEDINVQDILQEALQNSGIDNTKDQMLGGINIKIEKPDYVKINKKTKSKHNKDAATNLKLEGIKTELQDDLDWNNMTLATVNNNTDVNKYHSMNRRDYINKNIEDLASLFGTNNKSHIDDHLDTMQTDLESLRELLRSDSYALDTNTLMGLFGADDPFYGLQYNPVDEIQKQTSGAKKQKGEIANIALDNSRAQSPTEDNAEGTNQLMSYTGNIPDFEDINLPELECDDSQEACASPADVEGAATPTLNTPQVVLRSPAYVPRSGV